MTSNGLLRGLDGIAWGDLGHAYGSAEDVPRQLRDLLSEDDRIRAKALWSLYGNIFHQGTRYEATRYAVPFLARMVRDGSTRGRDKIVMLLASIAIGYDEAYLPHGYDPAGDRLALAALRAETEEGWERQLDEWVASAPDEPMRRMREGMRAMYSLEAQIRDAEAVVLAYDAIREELPRLTGLLAAADAELRNAVAYLLAWFPEAAQRSVPALATLLSTESSVGVAASAMLSLGLLGGSDVVPAISERLGSGEPMLRWAAAVALARLGVVTADVVEALASAAAEPPEQSTPAVAFLGGDRRGLASQSLAAASESITPQAFDAVLGGLADSAGIGSFSIASAALHLAFPTGPAEPLPPFGDLNGSQQRVVRALAELGPETWQWVNFANIVGAWHLPNRHEELRAYAGVSGPVSTTSGPRQGGS